MRLPSFSYLINSFLKAFRRFPIPMFAAVVATVCVILFIEDNMSEDFREPVFKILLTSFIFFPLLIVAVAAKESFKHSISSHILTNIAILIGALLYWKFGAPDFDDHQFEKIARFFLFLSVSHLAVTFIPYLKNAGIDDFWEYNRSLFVNYVTGALYGILIFAGISFALLALKYLFDINFNDEIFGHLFAVTAGIFHTSFFLSNFPNNYEFEHDQRSYQRGFINLVKFVFIPISILYFVILYAYGLKILFSWDLPEGWVSKLVIGFSVAGILTYLLNYMLPKIEGSGWVRTYRRYFYAGLLPVAALLFVAIFRRISDYGITEERYFVLMTGIWLALNSLYFIFSKKDDIRFIPVSLAVFCLIAAAGGPLSAFSVAEKSQINRLENLLSEANILQNGQIVKAVPPVEDKRAGQITSIVQYLFSHDHSDALQQWIPNTDSLDKDGYYYEMAQIVLDSMGVTETTSFTGTKDQFFNFTANKFEVVEIAPYRYFSSFEIFSGNRNSTNNPVFLALTKNKQDIIFYQDGRSLDTLQTGKLLTILQKDFGVNKMNNLPLRQMSHLQHGNQYDYFIAFDAINFRTEGDSLQMEYANGHIFWIEKTIVEETSD